MNSQIKIKSVHLGEHNTNTEKDCSTDDKTYCAPEVLKIEVAEVIAHPNYAKKRKYSHNDIALLRLQRKVEFNDFVRPICLPLDDSLRTKDYTGETFYAAGWGRHEEGRSSSIKKKVDLKFFPSGECQKLYKDHNIKINDTQVC